MRQGDRRIQFGLLPAAGTGRRALPLTESTPKVLLEVGGKTLIQRNLEILCDDLGVTEVVVILGPAGGAIETHLERVVPDGVRLHFVTCPDPSVGLAQGMLLAQPLIPGPFATLLADELYLASNHCDLTERYDLEEYRDVANQREPAGINEDSAVVCGVLPVSDPETAAENYAVRVQGGHITHLTEKPLPHNDGRMGCGTYLFTEAIFDAIRESPVSPRSGVVELTDAIAQLARRPGGVRPFVLSGNYLNVNTGADLERARVMCERRAASPAGPSVVIPAFQEESTIGHVVADFLPHCGEVLVVDNGSSDRTAEVASAAGARVLRVVAKGYGDTIRVGLDQARGEPLVITEADGSFRSQDLPRLLEQLKSADMALGTRTRSELIQPGANMGTLLRLGNIAAGKFVGLLWWRRGANFTDVGCSYRALTRDTWRRIRRRARGTGPEFSPEMMVEVLHAGLRVVEVPITYHPRAAGQSKHSAGPLAVLKTASRMLRLVLAKRMPWLGWLAPRPGGPVVDVAAHSGTDSSTH